ncbi:hypothetical protein MN608_09059 [Microdochium nivale]|nr:hypothetical protein MN608_09059 [Microdochium nivale]
MVQLRFPAQQICGAVSEQLSQSLHLDAPAYHDVVKILDAKTDNTFTPADLDKIKSSLSPQELKALVENIPADPTSHIDLSKLTDEQRKKLIDGMTDHATHLEIDALMAKDVKETAESAATIRDSYTTIRPSHTQVLIYK